MKLEPGYLVSKQVKLVRMLSGGGMGCVWIADHLALESQVAVKFILGNHSQNPALHERFKREATSAARIKSPHVVQIHDHGTTDDGDPYMVMELLEGEDLSTRMKRVGPMPLDQVATIIQQTCRVLTKAHQLDIVHRDIKPSNIFLVDTDGEIFIKLLDFGVAKTGHETSELTTTGVLVGTMVYMSPEQLLDARSVNHRADLWSLAVVAYRIITGRLPFKDEKGIGQLVLALDQGIYAPPSQFVPDLPKPVEAWFATAFRRKPDARFANAKDMAKEFFRAIGRADDYSTMSTGSKAAISQLSDARDALSEPIKPNDRANDETRVDDRSASAVAPKAPLREDPATVGATVRLSLNEASELSSPVRPSAFRRGIFAIAAAVLVLLSTGFFFLRRGNTPAPVTTATDAQAPSLSLPSANSAPAMTAAPSAEPAPTASLPAAGASAMASADPVSSAAPASAGSARGGLKGRMPGRYPRVEKDYGF